MVKRQGKGVNFIVGCILGLAVLVFAATATFAAYTNQGYQKGVVSTTSQDAKFSSNILRHYELDSVEGQRAERNYSLNFFGVSAGNYSTTITVCNFPQGKTNQVNEQQVDYDITFTAVPLGGATLTSDMLPQIKGVAAETQTFRDTLEARIATIAEYKVIFPEAAVDHIMLKVTATPKDSSVGATSNLLLYREIYPMETETVVVEDFSCEGYFADDKSVLSTDYHAFNYQIVVQNGKGNAVLIWNSSMLKIDPFWVDDMAKAGVTVKGNGTDGTHSMLEFTVDSAVQNVYDIVFYRDAEIPEENWTQVESLVSFTATRVE